MEADRPPPVEAESNSRAFLSAVVTLTLGILGSSVLPVPWAYARSSVAAGLLIAFVVAAFNTYTGTLLLRAAAHLQVGSVWRRWGKGTGRRQRRRGVVCGRL